MIRTLKYSRLSLGSLSMYGDHVGRGNEHSVNWRKTTGKLAVVGTDENEAETNPLSCLRMRSCNRYESRYDATKRFGKLFIASGCKTPRDLFRNSNYKIVRDPASADAVVIPIIPSRYFYTFRADIVVLENDHLHLLSLERSYCTLTDEKTKEVITDYFVNNFSANPEDVIVFCEHSHPVRFIPNEKEYEEILQGKNPMTVYVEETKIFINYPNKICVETLDIWEKFGKNNKELAQKAIVSSNWSEYPITLAFFFYMNPEISIYSCTESFRTILNAVDYDRSLYLENYLKGKFVSTKDWNMLQDYVLHKLGIDGDMGYVDNPKSFDERFFYVLFSKMAVKANKLKGNEDDLVCIDNLVTQPD